VSTLAGEGAILKKAREEKGWTYQDIENVIKIRARYLKALDQEEYDVLPGVTYTKGFLRNYAKYLGLDPEEIIGLYNISRQQEVENKVQMPPKPVGQKAFWFKPLVIVLFAVVVIGIIYGISYFGNKNDTSQNAGYNPPPLPSAPVVEEPSDEEGQIPDGSSPTPTEEYSGIVAEITFTDRCWMRVKIDGGPPVDSMNYKGETKVLRGSREIEFVSIGNPGGMIMKLNGVEIEPLGKQPVFNIVINQDTIDNLPQDRNLLPEE